MRALLILNELARSGKRQAEAVRQALAHCGIDYVEDPAAGNLDAKIQKRDWVLECYRRTARQATTHGKVPRIPKLSRQTFLDNYYALNRPVVMTGAMDN